MKLHDNNAGARPIAGVIDRIAALFASGLFIGYIPIASGTWGSLWVPALYYVVPADVFGWVLILGMPVITLLGVAAAGRCEQFWGDDPARVIIDEVAGMLVTLLFVPLTAPVVWAGFVLFRLFDIIKPPPVRWIDQRLPGGWGVMLDDVLAGVYANLALRLLILLAPSMLGVSA